jgi:hypothetical protein
MHPSMRSCIMQRVDATGDCQPRKFGGHKRYALAEHEDKVRALVAEKPDLTITELWQNHRARGRPPYSRSSRRLRFARHPYKQMP